MFSKEVLSNEAARLYHKAIPGAGALWSYLRFDQITPIARAIGRPLEASELRMLVEIDGGYFSATCYHCRKKFTPINWVDVDPVLDILWNQKKGSIGLSIAQAEPRRFGAFYRQGGELIAFCGSPWFRRQDGRYVQTMSHLGRIKRGWGTTRYFTQNPPKPITLHLDNQNFVLEEK